MAVWIPVFHSGRGIQESDVISDSTQRLRQIFDAVPIAMAVIDLDNHWIDTNDSLHCLLGWTGTKQTSIKSVDVVHADDLNDAARQAKRVLLGEESSFQAARHRLINKDGETIEVALSATLLRDPDGAPLYWLYVFNELTGEIGTEEALRESEERYRALAENAHDLISEISADGNFLYLSPNHRDVLGWEPAELVGARAFDSLDPELLETVQAAFAEVLSHGRAELNLRVRHADGGWRWFDCTGKSYKTGSGEQRIVAISRDVTKRREAEALDRKRQAELAHISRLAVMGEMASAVAHEVNQPLSAIVSYAAGCLRRLQAGDSGSSEVIRAMEEVVSQACRAGEIIRRMRRFIGKPEPNRTALDVSKLVEEAVCLARHEALRLDVDVRLDLAQGLPSVEADDVQVLQAILNFVKSGIEASARGADGHRVLTIRSVRNGDSAVEVALCDCGPGIPVEDADRVFEPFSSALPGGGGMGLPVSRSIVENCGGRVWMTPNSDRGVTFHMTLPFAQGVDGHGH